MVNQAFVIYDIYDQGEDLINLTINVGYGQVASSNVRLNELVLGDFEGSFSLNLDKSKTLKNRTLNVYTTIHDIQPDTDKVYLDLKLEGGKHVHSQVVLDSTVPLPGSFATCIISVFFV